MFEELPSDFDCQEVYSPPLPPQEPLAKHIGHTFGGIYVPFPYEAYPSQKEMMNKMVDSMNTGTNALLESPTGTGKTAALLCASLAWQKKKMADNYKNTINRTRRQLKPGNSTDHPRSSETDEKVPLIIYASRTHSQLKQVVDQLKKTAYADTEMVILASRKHFCINQVAIDSPSVDDTCDKMCANLNNEAADLKELPSQPSKKPRPSTSRMLDSSDSRRSNIRSDEGAPSCPYYNVYKIGGTQTLSGIHANEFILRNKASWDIEELKMFGRSERSCPYYISKKLLASAKLILCNYNHLLHPWIRKALELDVKGNIVIFDEAHNIETTCRQIGSKEIHLEALTNQQDGILFKLDEEMDKQFVPNEPREALENLTFVFKNLRRWIDDNNSDCGFELLKSENNRQFYVKNIEKPLDEFQGAGLGAVEISRLRDCLKVLCNTHDDVVYDEDGKAVVRNAYKCDAGLVRSMSSLIFPFQTLFWKDGDDYSNLSNYSVDLVKEIDKRKSSTQYKLKLHLTCLNPNVLFKHMACARSIIVTSGTLTPIDSFTSELGITFTNVLNAPHVIDSRQLWARVITEYRDVQTGEKVQFKFTHNNLFNRNDPKFVQHAHTLGQLLLKIANIVPHGVLVFCTSKVFLERLRSYWENNENDFLDELKKLKELFFEDKIKPSELQDEIMRYRECAEGTPKGAMLFAVFKGSVSEGVDFADNHARAVVTIGIPYLPMFEIAVKRKRCFNDHMKETDSNFIDGRYWYQIQAYRALNQALGRCIRHKGDWGAILMVDHRCASSDKISKWVNLSGLENGAFEDFELKLKAFIADRSNT